MAGLKMEGLAWILSEKQDGRGWVLSQSKAVDTGLKVEKRKCPGVLDSRDLVEHWSELVAASQLTLGAPCHQFASDHEAIPQQHT